MTDTHPDPRELDDHAFAVWAAEQAGAVLLQVRAGAADNGLEGRALKDAGDAAAQEVLARVLGEHRPDDAVLSEEAADDKGRLDARRVWIIDPLDGTREFSEPPRDDWAVHVALWEDGDLVAGAVAQPALGETFSTGTPRAVSARTAERPRIAVSRTRPPAFVEALAAEIDAELVPMGSAGVKVMSVVRDLADAYVHAGGQYQWDNAAPVAVARAAGLHCSRVDGSPLVYNEDDTSLPDLIVCRPELAEQIIAFVRDHGTD
ncbi:3'(2'),5'-bisphosphate nucleotidase CysQ [Nocardioides sediminis]|uniref:3'(2'),5'-bisphosphate nucleotidase CysQ n=1 Tax=Nocardioides sediminis TaxID=433648 RepID=UPI000D305949|nr:3'(2'),5'-bisphosphate nucleotidase CysQ [Nocardioides sediminis]